MSPKEFRTVLVIGLAAGIAAVLSEKALKPSLKNTFKI